MLESAQLTDAFHDAAATSIRQELPNHRKKSDPVSLRPMPRIKKKCKNKVRVKGEKKDPVFDRKTIFANIVIILIAMQLHWFCKGVVIQAAPKDQLFWKGVLAIAGLVLILTYK